MRDHGGNLDAAITTHGGDAGHWLDLSTGINPRPYPLPDIPASAWNALPTASDIARLGAAAQRAFCTQWPCLPTAGAQAGIQMVPRVLSPATARVLGPTYNEHAASLRAAGWQVTQCSDIKALMSADLAVVVNPNNPDGALFTPKTLLNLARNCGLLIVDESFCDPHPENSVLPCDMPANVVVFRSFGKFYGLAGVRLGFTFGPKTLIAKLKDLSGPWPVSGPAIAIGTAALSDRTWQTATIARLTRDANRLDEHAKAFGWTVVGGTTLFRLYDTPNAAQAQNHLARHHIWSRIFPYSDRWIRLGLPDGPAAWARLETALARQT